MNGTLQSDTASVDLFPRRQRRSMLVMNGGRERTEAGYRKLLYDAGLARAGIVPMETGASVLEARLA